MFNLKKKINSTKFVMKYAKDLTNAENVEGSVW